LFPRRLGGSTSRVVFAWAWAWGSAPRPLATSSPSLPRFLAHPRCATSDPRRAGASTGTKKAGANYLREDSQNVLDWRLYTKLIKDASRYGTLEETLAIYKYMVSRKVNQNSLIRTSLLYGKEKKWFECLDHFSKWKKTGKLKPMNYITMIKHSPE
jgi:hypothetical protein